MDWVLENLQVVGAIVVAAAYWLNQAREAKAAEKERQRRAAEGLPEEEEEFEFEEEEIEAEVMGRRAVPPPLVQVKPPALPVPPVLTQDNSTELQRQEQLMDRLRQVRAERSASPASGAAATQRKVAAKGKGVVSAVPIGLKARLRNRGEVRRAMVLKEILGKPMGLE